MDVHHSKTSIMQNAKSTAPVATDIFTTLESLYGKKATILKYGEMGFIHSIPCTIFGVFRKDYAQYKDCVHVTYQPKHKRSMYVWRIFDYQTFAVFAGHVELQTDMFVSKRTDEDGTKIKTSLLSFSVEYLDIALRSTTESAVLVQRRD